MAMKTTKKTNKTMPQRGKKLKFSYLRNYKECVPDPFNLTHKNDNYLNECVGNAKISML